MKTIFSINWNLGNPFYCLARCSLFLKKCRSLKKAPEKEAERMGFGPGESGSSS
jgi:hypothetical protein